MTWKLWGYHRHYSIDDLKEDMVEEITKEINKKILDDLVKLGYGWARKN